MMARSLARKSAWHLVHCPVPSYSWNQLEHDSNASSSARFRLLLRDHAFQRFLVWPNVRCVKRKANDSGSVRRRLLPSASSRWSSLASRCAVWLGGLLYRLDRTDRPSSSGSMLTAKVRTDDHFFERIARCQQECIDRARDIEMAAMTPDAFSNAPANFDSPSGGQQFDVPISRITCYGSVVRRYRFQRGKRGCGFFSSGFVARCLQEQGMARARLEDVIPCR